MLVNAVAVVLTSIIGGIIIAALTYREKRKQLHLRPARAALKAGAIAFGILLVLCAIGAAVMMWNWVP